MVKGISELSKKAAAIPKRTERAARGEMEKGAEELVAMMKRLVPVDEGDLRDSIRWTWGNAPKGSVVFAQSAEDSRGLKITVFATDFKARWIEFGTAPHKNEGLFAGTDNPGTRAQPFFFPSYRSLKKRIQARIKRETRKALKLQGPPIEKDAD